MDQIESKEYSLPFIGDSRTVIRIGVNFSGKTRNIEDWMIKRKGIARLLLHSIAEYF